MELDRGEWVHLLEEAWDIVQCLYQEPFLQEDIMSPSTEALPHIMDPHIQIQIHIHMHMHTDLNTCSEEEEEDSLVVEEVVEEDDGKKLFFIQFMNRFPS